MIKKTEKKLTCSICQGDIDVQPGGWAGGHNAEPINSGRCCTECNTTEVLPERMARILLAERKSK